VFLDRGEAPAKPIMAFGSAMVMFALEGPNSRRRPPIVGLVKIAIVKPAGLLIADPKRRGTPWPFAISERIPSCIRGPHRRSR